MIKVHFDEITGTAYLEGYGAPPNFFQLHQYEAPTPAEPPDTESPVLQFTTTFFDFSELDFLDGELDGKIAVFTFTGSAYFVPAGTYDFISHEGPDINDISPEKIDRALERGEIILYEL